MKLFAHILTVSCVVLLLLAQGRANAQVKDVIDKLPEPETIALKTKDLVALRCTYYPGGVIEGRDKTYTRKPGKIVVPVVLLHGWEGQRGDYDALASYLQRFGHAVFVPDLRGHGGSTTRRFPNGAETEIDPERMRGADITAMVADVEAVKSLILEKNNRGELNIEMLCIVGAEMGAIVAVNYAALDWDRRQLSFQKQGRDVKALALLSPLQSFKGATLTKTLNTTAVKQLLSIMLVVGDQDRESLKDTKSIFKRLERFHKEPEPKDIVDRKSLFLIEKPTSLVGTNLVHPRASSLKVPVAIATFIQYRLVNKHEDLLWKERKNPLAAESE